MFGAVTGDTKSCESFIAPPLLTSAKFSIVWSQGHGISLSCSWRLRCLREDRLKVWLPDMTVKIRMVWDPTNVLGWDELAWLFLPSSIFKEPQCSLAILNTYSLEFSASWGALVAKHPPILHGLTSPLRARMLYAALAWTITWGYCAENNTLKWRNGHEIYCR